jgi:ABC-type transport system substrate-binding protein
MPLPKAVRAIDAGTVDLILNGYSSPEQVDRYMADPDLAARVFRITTDLFVGYAAMNLAIPPFDDVHVRKAVNLAFDDEEWVRIANETGSEQLGWIAFTPFGHIAPDGTEASLLRGYDPYPFDPAAARDEMALSAYDGDGDGVCDYPACDHVFALDTDFGIEAEAERAWIEGLSQIGITLEIRRIPNVFRFLEISADPSRKIALNLGTFWYADYPNPSTFFPTQFRADGIGLYPLGNVSLVGARPDQLEAWGYDVADIPDVDAKIGECLALIGFGQTRCWAELDQLLMTEVVPWVPQVGYDYTTIVSERVVRFSVDQALGAWAAPDQIALAAGSD